MKLKNFLPLFLALALSPTVAFSAAPYSTQPGYEPSIPSQFPAQGGGGYPVALPPHLPEYLPNGAVNLDEAWIQDGGARLYWDTVIIPKQLKMAGATWIDPALVPQLFPPQQPARKRYYRRRARVSPPKVVVPADAASTSLRSPAIPLPVTPVTENEPAKIPPLKATAHKSAPKKRATRRAAPKAAAPAPTVAATEPDTTLIEPPRLQ